MIAPGALKVTAGESTVREYEDATRRSSCLSWTQVLRPRRTISPAWVVISNAGVCRSGDAGGRLAYFSPAQSRCNQRPARSRAHGRLLIALRWNQEASCRPDQAPTNSRSAVLRPILVVCSQAQCDLAAVAARRWPVASNVGRPETWYQLP